MKIFTEPQFEILKLDVMDILTASYEGDWAELEDEDWE